MAVRTAAELAIDITTKADKATAGFDSVERSVGSAESAVKSLGDTSERTSRQIGISADAADELGGKAGKATGALGALSSGFELVGAEKYAGALQGAGMATDFFSGVGDSLNLVMESTIVKTARARVAAIAHGVATKASAVATAVMTGAQWALNAALNANPVALIVLGVIALVAAVVLAYKKSETFRRIVDGAFRAVQAAASFAFEWVKRNWPLLLAILTGPVGLAVLAVVKNFDRIQAAVSATKKWISDRMGEVPGILGAVGKAIEDVLLAPFRLVEKSVQKIIDLVSKIKIPHIPNPFGRVAGGTSDFITPGGTVTAGPTTSYSYTFNVSGILDADDAAAKIQQLLDRRSRLFGPA